MADQRDLISAIANTEDFVLAAQDKHYSDAQRLALSNLAIARATQEAAIRNEIAIREAAERS